MSADIDPARLSDVLAGHAIGRSVHAALLDLDPGQVAQIRARVAGRVVGRWPVDPVSAWRLAPLDLAALVRVVVELEPGQLFELDPLDGSGGALRGRISRTMPRPDPAELARRGPAVAAPLAPAAGGVTFDPQAAALVMQLLEHHQRTSAELADLTRHEVAAWRGLGAELVHGLARASHGGAATAELIAAHREITRLSVELATARGEAAALRVELVRFQGLARAALEEGQQPGGVASWIAEIGEAAGPIVEALGPLLAAYLSRGAPPGGPPAAEPHADGS